MKKRILIGYAVLAAGLLAMAGAAKAAESMVVLPGHISGQTQTAAHLGRLSGGESISLELVARVDSDLLAQIIRQEYGSQGPGPKHFLSASEFAQIFGLSDKRAQLKNFAQAHGLTVDPEDRPESMIVKVSGPASAVETAFHVQLNQYQKSDGRLFHAIETDPLIPASLAPHLGAILGLSNGMEPAHSHVRSPASRTAAAGLVSHAAPPVLTGQTGPCASPCLAPADIKTIYGLNATALKGTGQTLALFELDGFTPSDIAHYETFFGLTAPPITYIPVDGKSNTPGGGAIEVTLDIELAVALAPGLSKILVYGAPNPGGIFDMYDKIATDNLAQIVSTSWGLNEEDSGSAFLDSENTIFKRMASQGQSVYAAAGDCGSYDQENGGGCITNNGFRVDDPASQPYVTGVGGTSLLGNVSAHAESTWNEFSIANGGGGGGVSSHWPISAASYQLGVAGTASQSFRNVPDVSLNADPDTSAYAIYFAAGGGWIGEGGTSAAAPLWAALTALINQARAAAGAGTLGFANAVLYTLPSSVYNDITLGNNGVSGHYNAGSGFDNATGFGSFKGSAILTAAGSAAPGTPPADAAAPLSNVHAYPNPWDARNPKDSVKRIKFDNLTDDSTVKIFTLAGFWIKTLPPVQGGETAWDLTNDSGQDAASGLYLYLINGAGTKVTGKVALIR